MTISAIDPANPALRYLENRVLSDNYRGMHASQHNRYDLDRVRVILEEFDRQSPNGQRMTIRDEDQRTREWNTPEEATYATFCHRVKLAIGVGTQDAMRKNFFVDFNRMGLLDRFDKDGQLVPPGVRRGIKTVALSELGLSFVRATSLLSQRYIYSAAIDVLLKGAIDVLLDVMSRLGVRSIDTHEFMFFVSAVGADSDIEVTREQAAEFVDSYRALARLQRSAVVDAVKDFATPHKFAGDKIDKRDFANWKNEADQIFKLLGQTVYFENRQGVLTLRSDKDSPVTKVRMARSLAEKHRYLREHGTPKVLGFELHHVVPLGSSTSLIHFLMLDDWKNMVYIDAFSHAKISQSGNKHVIMTAANDDIILSDIAAVHPPVLLGKDTNIKYGSSKLPVMLKYNYKLNHL